MNEQELAQVAQRLFESEHFYFKEFERFLEGSVWDEIRSSVPEDEQQRLELESITLEVAWDMTILTFDDTEMAALVKSIESSEMEPSQKLLAAHALYRLTQGKNISEPEIPLIGEILGDEVADELRRRQNDE